MTARKGKLPIPVPKGTEVKIANQEISVKGPKGTLHQKLVPGVQVVLENNQIIVSLEDTIKNLDNFHGLYRTLIANMVEGTTKGFESKLEMIGVGYRAIVQGRTVELQIGVSHPTKLTIPEGLNVAVEKNTLITVTGIDKQKVGQFAADIRAFRPPEPYQGKGIRYLGEYVRRKEGKKAGSKK